MKTKTKTKKLTVSLDSNLTFIVHIISMHKLQHPHQKQKKNMTQQANENIKCITMSERLLGSGICGILWPIIERIM